MIFTGASRVTSFRWATSSSWARRSSRACGGYEAKYAPLTIEEVGEEPIDWWLTTEDLPDVKNQVRVAGTDRIVIDYTENNSEPFARG